MKFRIVRHLDRNPARSPFRIVEQETSREVDWVNRFLDRECIRRVAEISLYGYAHCLLHFLRWWESVHHTADVIEGALTESTLLDYVRFQSSHEPPLSGCTINQRVAVVDRALRTMFPDAPSQVAPGFQVTYWRRAPMGLGRQMPALSRVRVKTPKRTIVPLSVEEVARFWASFRTSRDLGHRGPDAVAGIAIQRTGGSESRRSAPARSTAPCPRQRRQDPFPATGPRSQSAARSLSATRTARRFRRRRVVCLSEGTSARKRG